MGATPTADQKQAHSWRKICLSEAEKGVGNPTRMAGGVNDRNKDSSGLVRRQVDLPRAVHLLGLRAPRSAFPTQDFFSLALSLSKTSNIPLSLIPRSRGLASTIASRQRRFFEPVCGSHPLPTFAQPDNSKHIDQWTAKKHPLISSHIVGDASRQNFDAIAKPVAEAIAIAQWPLAKCPVGAGDAAGRK